MRRASDRRPSWLASRSRSRETFRERAPMEEPDHERQLHQILRSNDWLVATLEAVRDCAMPDWIVGGGVIRNLVWDRLHGYTRPTPIADVDVAFYDPNDLSPECEHAFERELLHRMPNVRWDVKNQAAV